MKITPFNGSIFCFLTGTRTLQHKTQIPYYYKVQVRQFDGSSEALGVVGVQCTPVFAVWIQ
jgi:hypothetical protein